MEEIIKEYVGDKNITGTILFPNRRCLYKYTNSNHNFVGILLNSGKIGCLYGDAQAINYIFGSCDGSDSLSLCYFDCQEINQTQLLDFKKFVNNHHIKHKEEILNLLDSLPKEPLKERIQMKSITHSIKAPNYDSAILTEMVGKVDKQVFKAILSVYATEGHDKTIVSDGVVNSYLRNWSRAKYEYFLLFNKNLSITNDIETKMSEDKALKLIEMLKLRFPKHAALIRKFSAQEFISNQVFQHDDYKAGMKLSKLFSELLHDETFNLELSKAMTERKVVGKTTISIDPCDYLMMSINQNGWSSCHKYGSCYQTGPFSYLCDDATLIAYKHNNKVYEYNLNGFNFKYNSKSWRQCVYFDKRTCCMIFSRQYPQTMDDVSKNIRLLLENTVSTYLNITNSWKTYSDKYEELYEDVSELHYSDVTNDYDFKFVKPSDFSEEERLTKIRVGFDVMCLCCGESYDYWDTETMWCKDCEDHDGNDDED